MAINGVQFQLLTATIRRLRKAVGDRRLDVLIFGYPDLLMPPQILESLVGADLLHDLPERADAAKVREWHRLAVEMPIYDSMVLFDRLGLAVTVADVAALQGMERIVDLNDPLPDDLRRRFDLVIDPGTCEHCFNVGMAFRNVCEAVKHGGFLVHLAPLTSINHGFWNFSPTIYPDYFEANGFSLLHLAGHVLTADGRFAAFTVEPFNRFKAPMNGLLYVVAERTGDQPPVWPVQRKYRAMLG
jgi:SAM-dependent methyltransferase